MSIRNKNTQKALGSWIPLSLGIALFFGGGALASHNNFVTALSLHDDGDSVSYP